MVPGRTLCRPQQLATVLRRAQLFLPRSPFAACFINMSAFVCFLSIKSWFLCLILYCCAVLCDGVRCSARLLLENTCPEHHCLHRLAIYNTGLLRCYKQNENHSNLFLASQACYYYSHQLPTHHQRFRSPTAKMSRNDCHHLLAVMLPMVYSDTHSGIYLRRRDEMLVPHRNVSL